jgi:hypothetical protein
MLIQSLIKRKNGTRVLLAAIYHFVPEDKSLKPGTPEFMEADHVANVTNQRDMAKLLAIPEGYAVYIKDEDADEPAKVTKPAEVVKDEPKDEPKDEEVDQGGNAGGEGEKSDNTTATATDNTDNTDDTADQDSNRANLAAEYETLAGKKPHGKWNATRIAQEIADLKAAQ